MKFIARFISFLVILIFVESCKTKQTTTTIKVETSVVEVEKIVELSANDSLIFPEEKHFKSLRQVTFGGDNAEAYWSFDDKQLVFQSNNKNWNVSCDQMFLMDADETFDGKVPPMLSTGKGRTTCAYFLPDNKHIIYASTHLGADECPENSFA